MEIAKQKARASVVETIKICKKGIFVLIAGKAVAFRFYLKPVVCIWVHTYIAFI